MIDEILLIYALRIFVCYVHVYLMYKFSDILAYFHAVDMFIEVDML